MANDDGNDPWDRLWEPGGFLEWLCSLILSLALAGGFLAFLVWLTSVSR